MDSSEQVHYCPSPKTDNESLEEEKKGRRKKAKAVNEFRDNRYSVFTSPGLN
jgi:hypothetical protein